MTDAVGSAAGASAGDRPPLERLEDARDRFEAADRRVEDRGGEAVERAADAYREATDLLDSYVDRATGTGRENFRAYVELEGEFATLVEDLPEDLFGREAFEEALEAIDKRRLSESDFERAREALAPAERYADLLDERESAREDLRDARRTAAKRRRELGGEIRERERLLDLTDADLEAPVEDRLREPIERYNGAVREAFADYREETPVREVFALLERSRWYPFVPFRRPPDDLLAYVRDRPAGERSIPQLLEYADYSRSKLSHYVADAAELKRQVATRQTFLEGIDAGALAIPWPPASAGVLERRVRERRPFVERVADESVVAALRDLRALARDPDYDRLQTAAEAVDRLSPAQRERLADGTVAAELEDLRAEREALADALAVDDPV